MKTNIIIAAAIIILFIPTIMTYYFKEETLNTFSKYEKYEKYEKSLNNFISWQFPESKVKVSDRKEEVLNKFTILQTLESEVYKHTESMTLYDKYIMSKILDERRATPLMFTNTRSMVENYVKEDEPCTLTNIKKRLECEQTRKNQINHTADKIITLNSYAGYKHDFQFEAIEAILIEATESTFNLLDITEISKETVYSDRIFKAYDTLLILTIGFSILGSCLLLNVLKSEEPSET